MSVDEKNEDLGNENPDTNTDDEIGGLDIPNPEVQEAIPVAESAPADAASAPRGGDQPSAPPVPPQAPSGPRVFPQHYTLLFGAVVTLVGATSVWERPHVFGAEVSGHEMISGTFLIAMALYAVIVGVVNIMTGRLRGMFAAFVTGVVALYLSIGHYFTTLDAPNFLSLEQIENTIKGTSIQDRLAIWVGQFGPGVWITLLGGVLITFVFLKAIVGGGKKKESAPAAASSRSGARRGRR